MNLELNYFSVHSIPYSGTNQPSDSQVLVLLDIQQTLETHETFLQRLSKQYDVVCLEMNNQSLTGSFHWAPTLDDINREFNQLTDQLHSVHCCIAQGFAATLIQYLPLSRMGDILCNPTLPAKDLRFVQVLSRLLWSSTKTSNWFTKLIEASWKEHLQWPLQGPSPWVSHLPSEQTQYSLMITNGSWKQILQRILQANKTYHPQNIVVFLGSESPALSSASPVQICEHFSSSSTRYRIFSGFRQELLLADLVQQDILHICRGFL